MFTRSVRKAAAAESCALAHEVMILESDKTDKKNYNPTGEVSSIWHLRRGRNSVPVRRS